MSPTLTPLTRALLILTALLVSSRCLAADSYLYLCPYSTSNTATTFASSTSLCANVGTKQESATDLAAATTFHLLNYSWCEFVLAAQAYI